MRSWTSLVVRIAIFTILWIDYNGIAVADDVERLPPINRSLWEDRDYRGIKLANGLQALLINDPTSDKSAAAMVVAAGTLNDEKEDPGVANLVRYLLLTTCLRYPKKNEFVEYLKQRGGALGSKYMTSEAEHEHLYSFEVNDDYLERTLNRFAQHFLDPQFKGVNKNALKEALIGSSKDHNLAMSKSAMRVTQVLKSISQQNHPYNNLTYGTVGMLNEYARLGDDPIDEKLMNFVRKWYSANLMRLVVISSRKNLDALEKIVIAAFSGIRNNNRERLMFPFNEHPWKSDQLTHKLCIVPVGKKPVREIRLNFPVPNVLKQYKISPQKYVAQFFNHTEPGTLGYILPYRGLCEPKSVKAEYHIQAGIAFFTITMEPTEKGVKDLDSILELTFQSIHLLKNKGVVKWLYEEEREIDALSFKVWGDQFKVIHDFAFAMHDYPFEDIISYQFVRDPFKAAPIRKFVSYLRPDNLNIAVVDKSCEGADELMKMEPWYKTKYQIDRIPPNLLKKWESAAGSSLEFRMPPRNELIPETLDIDTGNQDENAPYHPFVIHNSPLSRIWYRRDDDLPMINIDVDIVSSAMHLHLMSGILLEIFIRMMILYLQRYEYSATKTARSWKITPTRTGFQIYVVTVPDKAEVLMEKIYSIMQNIREVFSEEMFEKAKEKTFSNIQKYRATSKSPLSLSMFYMSFILNSGGWTADDVSALENSFQYQRMDKFVPRLLSRIHIQGLIYGNCDKYKAKELADIIEKYFKPSSRMILPQQLLNVHERPVQVDHGENFVYRTSSDGPKHHYHAYFQFGEGGKPTENIRLSSLALVLLQIIGKACEEILIPPRETGTSVCRVDSVKEVDGFVITITSTMDPDRADRRAEQFLEMMKNKLHFFPPADFTELRNNLMMHRALESNTRNGRLNEYWMEITQRKYNFEKSGTESREFRTIRKEHVIAFFKKNLAKKSPVRRKVAAYVYSNALVQKAAENIPPADDEDSEELESTEIEDIITFKMSSNLLPTLLPITNLLPERKLL